MIRMNPHIKTELTSRYLNGKHGIVGRKENFTDILNEIFNFTMTNKSIKQCSRQNVFKFVYPCTAPAGRNSIFYVIRDFMSCSAIYHAKEI